MAIIDKIMVEVYNVVERELHGRNLGGTQTTTATPTPQTDPTSTSAASSSTTTASGGGGGGPTSSPLLFFVALGFGVVFTNLWIIVGVKYCFRYNARNRALRNGEAVDPIGLENMPTRPHRRRREKKLMTMDEVNERFPLTKYKNWVATRAKEGLPTTGGVAAPQTRPGSLREADAIVPSSPVDTKHSVPTRPPTPASEEIQVSAPTHTLGGSFGNEKKSMEVHSVVEKGPESPTVEEQNTLEEVQTTASTVNKHATATSEEDEIEEDDDHIHTAVPPELLTNPGDSCAICIDTLEEDDDIRGLTCGHAFHAGCLDPWLTSRRACCPLCKADYYTPKTRPEGEAAEAERSTRRSGRMPQPPPSTWAGLRGNPRLVLAGRLGAPAGDATYGGYSRRSRRTAPREAVPAHEETGGAADGNAETNEQPARRNWRTNLSSPFRNIRVPAVVTERFARLPPPEQPSPSQLESGITR